MTLELARQGLLICLGLNYGILLLWFLVFACAHAWLYGLHRRWFRLTIERFDALHYQGMAIYKIGVLLFNLTPYLAITLIQRGV